MPYTIEDLGVTGYGSANLDGGGYAMARNPLSGTEVMLHPMFEFGFIVIDPVSGASRHVRPEDPAITLTGRGAVQAADGLVYQVGCQVEEPSRRRRWSVLRWDWQSPGLRFVADCPPKTSWYRKGFASPDGALYFGGSDGMPTYRFEPGTGEFKTVGDFGAVIVNKFGHLYTQRAGVVVRIDPRGGAATPVLFADGSPCPAGHIELDGGSRAILITGPRDGSGPSTWYELADNLATRIRPGDARLVTTVIGNNELAFDDARSHYLTPYVFSDGGYIARIIRKEITHVDAQGRARTFAFERHDAPLRLFSVEACGDKIWMGSVLPLNLISYEPTTRKFTNYGNPTTVPGETYNIAASQGRIFFANYPHAVITRFDPAQPWRLDHSAQANPKHLGRMKDDDLPVHRIHGKAVDASGTVFFSAFGDYGCVDSAIVKIDPATDRMTRWLYRETSMGAVCWLPGLNQLLLSELRGDGAVRFTFVSPEDGKVLWSERVIEDHGMITSWLHDGEDTVYGLHDYRATLFAFSLRERRIVRKRAELGMGHHTKNSLVFGTDGRIWGQTYDAIFAIGRELGEPEVLARYEDRTARYVADHSRFGLCFGPDGGLYFINGPHLMRMIRT